MADGSAGMSAAWSIVVRCDASPAIGFGHVIRSLALARELTDRGAATVSFAMCEGIALVSREGYRVLAAEPDGPFDAQAWLSGCVSRARADALVLDVRDELPRASIETLRAAGLLIATVDDPTERRLAADLAFFPPVPQVREFDWSGFSGALLVGAEWVVLRRQFAEPPVRASRARPTVLVTMGGSDPAGMTLTAVEALVALPDSFDVTVVLGPGYGDRMTLDERLARSRHPITVVEQPADMRAVMLNADLAVASFGVTAYELAATATPAVFLCLADDHARSASVFEACGAAISLGVHSRTPTQRLAEAVGALLADDARRSAMGRAGRSFVDGSGAGRVADRIIAALEERRREHKAELR